MCQLFCQPLATWLTSVVLGDSISIKQVAAAYSEVYGVEPEMMRLGSLEDLHRQFVETRKAQPNNIYTWMPLLVSSLVVSYYTVFLALTVYRNYNSVMLNGSTSLQKLDNNRYPQISPSSVRQFLQKHKREDLPRTAMII